MSTAHRMCAAAKKSGHRVTWSRLKTPKIVNGVGSGAAVAEYQVSIEGTIDTLISGKHVSSNGSRMKLTYTAPVVSGPSSEVPALLGLREMKRAGCVFLPRSQRLVFMPENGEEAIQFPS
eukprot:230629-Amphidinium_carterae.1